MSEPKPIKEIIESLSEQIADRHLETRNQGGKDLTYISWHNAIRYLDLKAPGWCYEVMKIHTDEKRIYVVVRVSIPAAEGIFWREATGTEELSCSSFGDPSSNAESMALRRAAAKFGLGLYLYDKSGSKQNGSRPPKQYAPAPAPSEVGDPISRSLNDLISMKQLGMARAIGREKGLDLDAECQKLFNVLPDVLTKKAASALIEHLQGA
jgi:hypothetical protein